jgi:hypothetical protein
VIEVFDAAGRCVRSMRLGGLRAGAHHERFDAFDARGRRLANGVYHVRITSGGAARSDRMLLLR